MSTTLPAADAPLLRRALQGGIRLVRWLDAEHAEVTSRRPGKIHTVWFRDGRTSCTCELSTLGYQQCPHGALVVAFVDWYRKQEGRTG